MRSYHESNHFTKEAVDLFRQAQRIVEDIPDSEEGQELWRCHEVARLVGEALGLEVVDGLCGHVSHSWLVVPRGGTDGHDAILDVYACGVLPQVLLLDTMPALAAATTYEPRTTREDIRHEAIRRMMGGVAV